MEKQAYSYVAVCATGLCRSSDPNARESTLVVGGVVEGRRRDLRITDGLIAEVDGALDRQTTDRVIDARGSLVLPGLHDHHLHLRALGAKRSSILVGPPAVGNITQLFSALRHAAAIAPTEWVRAVGYHESVCGALDRRVLDAAVAHIPVRVQHRSGALWMLNSAGIATLGLDAVALPGVERDAEQRPTGRIFRMDSWLAGRVPPVPLDLAAVSARLAAWGVTGITDATPGATAAGLDELTTEVQTGRILQRLCIMCPADVPFVPHPLVTRGPHKLLFDDDNLPTLDDLARTIAHSHDRGAPVAVHCVTRTQLVLTVEAIRAAGTLRGDRIEHAAVLPPEAFHTLRALRVTVVTNPSFVVERGDAYLSDVAPDDRPHLYRCHSLLKEGIPVAAGTDAPFAGADPWAAIDAAVSRKTLRGRLLGKAERVSPGVALGLFTGRADAPAARRRLLPGEPGDLCVVRLPDAESDFPRRSGLPGRAEWHRQIEVLATIVAGHLVYSAARGE